MLKPSIAHCRNLLAPCSKISYRARTHKFTKYDGLTWIQDEANNLTRPVFVYYPSTNVMEYQETLLMTMGDLVCSLGGGLGLFLGFSALSIFSWAIEKSLCIEIRGNKGKSGWTNSKDDK